MSSSIDEFLNHVDHWKLKLHKKLRRMTPLQRKDFWQGIREEARAHGLRVVDSEMRTKRPAKRARRTG
jgi:hypothetical protein